MNSESRIIWRILLFCYTILALHAAAISSYLHYPALANAFLVLFGILAIITVAFFLLKPARSPEEVISMHIDSSLSQSGTNQDSI